MMKSVEEFMKSKNLKINNHIDSQKISERKVDNQEITEEEIIKKDVIKDKTNIEAENSRDKRLKSLEELDKAKTKVLKYIAYKKRTENEVRTKFKDQIQEEILEEIIEYLKQAHYLNDYEFIQKQINEYMKLKTMSIKEIKYKLYSKGLDRKLVEKYIDENREELEEYEKNCIEKIKIKKSGTMNEQEIKQFLYRKGYNIN